MIVTKLRKVIKTFNKIRLVDLDAHKYSLCAHINSIIFTYHI